MTSVGSGGFSRGKQCAISISDSSSGISVNTETWPTQGYVIFTISSSIISYTIDVSDTFSSITEFEIVPSSLTVTISTSFSATSSDGSYSSSFTASVDVSSGLIIDINDSAQGFIFSFPVESTYTARTGGYYSGGHVWTPEAATVEISGSIVAYGYA